MRFLLPVLFIACTSSSPGGDDDVSGQPGASCERYLSCLLIASPEAYAAHLALYGSSSECWKTPQQTENCEQACSAAFQDIEHACTCTGTTCMPNTPPAECNDTFEPNDDMQHAHAAGGGANGAICPANEVDLFSVSVGATATMVVDVTWSAGGPLVASVLNGSGNALANATPQTGGVRASIHLPSGDYYVRITGSTKTDYHLAVMLQ